MYVILPKMHAHYKFEKGIHLPFSPLIFLRTGCRLEYPKVTKFNYKTIMFTKKITLNALILTIFAVSAFATPATFSSSVLQFETSSVSAWGGGG